MSFKIIVGDAVEALKKVEDGSVQTCVTSPPYFGLRDYETAGQLGLEKTPREYVDKLVTVFREVRRCLRDDGTVWLNLGDSYASTGGHGKLGANSQMVGREANSERRKVKGSVPDGFKTKDLMGIPWRVAFALQDDGWYLRSDIVWAKPNPMPESVLDRPTRSHEYLFLLTKSPNYFYDAEAIKEPSIYAEDYRKGRGKVAYGVRRTGEAKGGFKGGGQESFCSITSTRNKRSVWNVSTKPCSWEFCKACGTLFKGPERKAITRTVVEGRHLRMCPCGVGDHWVDHFAAFPLDLIEPCVLAGTSAKGRCLKCWTPWVRTVERTRMVIRPGPRTGEYGSNTTDSLTGTMLEPAKTQTSGWLPGCACGIDDDPEPCVVVDPFCGSGTTGVAAAKNKLSFVGCEINPDYALVSRALIERAS